MTLYELDNWFNSFLKKENFPGDPSLNGIQIENAEPNSKQIKKIAFAVDACQESAEEAVKQGADVLFVHHGLFWGDCKRITGSHYKRVSEFIKHDLALCAYHIPLDANNPYGNNYGLASKLNLTNLQPFGLWRGMTLGVYGTLPSPLSITELADKLARKGHPVKSILDFGKKEISTVGIISGGASSDVADAVASGLDAYITGEFEHEDYHFAKEMKINVIGGGHYETETVGVNLVKEKVEKELGVETTFIDLPTDL